MEAKRVPPQAPDLRRLASPPDATATRTNTGLRRLRLIPENRRLLPSVPRSMHLVRNDLVDLFTQLVGGVAPWPLYLWGSTGSGKTSAALALCDLCYTAAHWELENFATFMLRHADELESELEHIGRKELLVVDEIGVRLKTGDLSYTALKTLCDVREQRAGRVMIAVSNIAPHEISGLYDDRIASRLLGGTVFELSGDDRREVRG